VIQKVLLELMIVKIIGVPVKMDILMMGKIKFALFVKSHAHNVKHRVIFALLVLKGIILILNKIAKSAIICVKNAI
jgi:hypothetical protein